MHGCKRVHDIIEAYVVNIYLPTLAPVTRVVFPVKSVLLVHFRDLHFKKSFNATIPQTTIPTRVTANSLNILIPAR